MGFSLRRLVAPPKIALPKPSFTLSGAREAAVLPATVNKAIGVRAQENSTLTNPPWLASLANNVTHAATIGDMAVSENRAPTRQENLQAVRGVLTVAAIYGAVVGGIGSIVGYVGKALKTGMSLYQVRNSLEARKRQKNSAEEAAAIDRELAEVNAQIAEEERRANSSAPGGQKNSDGVAAIAAGGLVALKVITLL